MNAGDHLRVLRAGSWDHAIDVGDRTVIRFRPGAGVGRVSRDAFTAGSEKVEVVVHREPTYAPRDVVARAFSRFAESAYRTMFAAPEQFAVWCLNGRLPAQAPPPPRARAGVKPALRKAARPRAATRKAATRKAARPARKAPRKAAAKRRRGPARRAAARPAPARRVKARPTPARVKARPAPARRKRARGRRR